MALDDPHAIARIDTAGMLGLTQRLGAMVAEGWEAAADLVAPRDRPAAIVTVGMGGSGIGGDLLSALLAPTAPVPVVVVKDERLPAFVDPRTLVFACSYSGNTEETLAAYGEAAGRGASIVAVTSGGQLAAQARAAGHPVVLIPGGLPPRASLPYLLMPMLHACRRLGLTDIGEVDIDETAEVLADLDGRCGPAVPSADNPAKRLAAALRGAIPVIYAASPATGPVAQRWKTQLNENSKVFAVWNTFPELTHNETVGWEGVADGGPPLYAVVLRDRGDALRAAVQVEVTRDLMLRRARGQAEIWSQGSGRLARVFSLILFGDLVSSYLAVLKRVDPTPTESIAMMKQRLGGA